MGVSLSSKGRIVGLLDQLINNVHRDIVSLTNALFCFLIPTFFALSGFIIKNLNSILILHCYYINVIYF